MSLPVTNKQWPSVSEPHAVPPLVRPEGCRPRPAADRGLAKKRGFLTFACGPPRKLNAGGECPWVRMSPGAGLWPTPPPLFRTQGHSPLAPSDLRTRFQLGQERIKKRGPSNRRPGRVATERRSSRAAPATGCDRTDKHKTTIQYIKRLTN